jgi:hypothetical protein
MNADDFEFQKLVNLWGAVIKLAIRDALKLEMVRTRPELLQWETKKYGRLLRHPDPIAFLESDRFREICFSIGASPDGILREIRLRALDIKPE